MKLFHNNIEILDIQVDDTSVRYRSIMQDNNLTLNFSTVEHVSVPVGSYCEFEGQRYTLYYPENFKKHNTRNFEYTLVLHSDQEALKLYKYKDLSAKPYRLKFPLTATPYDFIKLLVDNLNQHDAGWNVGGYVENDDKLISFNHESCYDILNRLASEFNTEWEIENKTIHLRKVEKYKDDPLALSYGKGNGFKSGVGRSNEGDKQPIGRLYVQGGERNLDYSKYGSRTLLLPKSASLVHDGKTYITDADGMFVTRIGNNNVAEDSLDASSIYPKRVGAVSEVLIVDSEKNLYDIVDSSIPSNLDFSECVIAGEKATIIFQSGALAGREFDIHTNQEGELIGYDHEERRFEIVPQELDGFTMPSGVFVPSVGDKYAIFNISMPDSYISDSNAQSGASWDMLREAVKYFANNEEPKFSFRGELDGVWSKNKWLMIGGKIQLGSHILFSDSQFQTDGIKIRITSIKDYVNVPHKPEITLSNAPISMSFSNDLGKIESEEVTRDEQNKDTLRFTKRQWRDTIETMGMLEKSLLNFSNSINPITIQTMQLLVGDESLQFRFVNSKTNPQSIIHNIIYNKLSKVLTSDAGIIQHMTLGITTIKKSHSASEYKFWDMPKYVSPPLTADKSYYLYARVSKSNQSGAFILSETSIKIDADASNYHLLVGILNSEYNGDRSYVSMYGFTEILPSRVTTDKIVSTDGRTYFDLVQGIISGRIKFLSNGVETDLNDWANTLQNDLSGLDTNIDNLEYYLTGAFKDGVISEAEAKAIESYINIIQSEKAAIEATYNKLFVNPLLSGTPKTNLLNAKVSYFGNVDSLINRINQVISDGKVTLSEKQQVNNTFATYRTSYALFSQRIQEANDSIQKALSDNTSAALAQANIAKAITDKFGTTIDGGLISTVIMLLRGHNSTTETAGTSGLQNGAAFWAGGTYTQALASLAKIIFNHDGSGQLAGGGIKWDENGNSSMQNVWINGIQVNNFAYNPFFYIEKDKQWYIDFQENNNVIIDTLINGSNNGWFRTKLPIDQKYNGMVVNVLWLPRDRGGLHWRLQSGNSESIMLNDGYTSQIDFTSDSNRHLQLLGFWDKTALRWLVLKNEKIAQEYDDRVKAGEMLIQGTTNASGGVRRASSNFGFTCSCVRNSIGRYTVKISKEPYKPLETGNYTVMVSGYGSTFYAVVETVHNETFTVYTADDSSPNDSAFSFMVVADRNLDLRRQTGL